MVSQKTLPLSLKPIIMRCDTFTNGDGSMDSRTIIVVPTRFQFKGDAWTVTWQCSRATACFNEECFYARHPRKEKEEEAVSRW
jgi:hypothetical protein